MATNGQNLFRMLAGIRSECPIETEPDAMDYFYRQVGRRLAEISDQELGELLNQALLDTIVIYIEPDEKIKRLRQKAEKLKK